MKPSKLKRKIKDTGYPDWRQVFEMAQESDIANRLITGQMVMRGHNLPPKLQLWVLNGNIGKVTALGLFVDFLRERGDEKRFLESWEEFLNGDKKFRRDVLVEAHEFDRKHDREILSDAEIQEFDEHFKEMLEDGNLLGKIRNPKYLAYRSSRQLISMLKREGTHFVCYKLERMLTEYFYKDERIVF